MFHYSMIAFYLYFISGSWCIFNGNQLGGLLAAYLWKHRSLMYPGAHACKLRNSIVYKLFSYSSCSIYLSLDYSIGKHGFLKIVKIHGTKRGISIRGNPPHSAFFSIGCYFDGNSFISRRLCLASNGLETEQSIMRRRVDIYFSPMKKQLVCLAIRELEHIDFRLS